MRILGYVGTYNDSVDRALQGLLDQTYPVTEILIVDNASEQPVIPETLPAGTTVLRTPLNIGPNSAVSAGLRYALDHNYDWMWLLESDGAPHKDALEKLIALYESFSPTEKNQVGILCCTQLLLPSTKLFQGRRLTTGGPRPPKINPDRPYCDVDCVLWNGALFKVAAVRTVGLPRCGKASAWEDLSYDFGDTEFTYRIKAAGYKLLTHRFSVVDQRVGHLTQMRILGRLLITTNHLPARRCLYFRNLVYFWLYIYPKRNWVLFGSWFAYRLGVTIAGIVLMEDNRSPKILACFKGIWHGIRKRLEYTY